MPPRQGVHVFSARSSAMAISVSRSPINLAEYDRKVAPAPRQSLARELFRMDLSSDEATENSFTLWRQPTWGNEMMTDEHETSNHGREQRKRNKSKLAAQAPWPDQE